MIKLHKNRPPSALVDDFYNTRKRRRNKWPDAPILKKKNGVEYYFYQLFYNENRPKDLYAKMVSDMEQKITTAKKEMDGDLSTDK